MRNLKRLAAAAAVLLPLGCNVASAKTFTISYDTFCNTGTIKLTSKVVVAYKETTASGSCQNVIGAGAKANTKVQAIKGNWLIIGELNDQYPGEEDLMLLQYPLVTGGTWLLYDTTDGDTTTFVNSGTYTIGGTAAKGQRGSQPIRTPH